MSGTSTGGNAMTDKQGAANCRWAVPTLFLGTPDWVDANDRPWSCLRDEAPHELESTAACETCVRWQPRSTKAVALGEPCDHLRAAPYFLDLLS